MPKKRGKITLKNLCEALGSPHQPPQDAQQLRQEVIHSAFHWITHQGKAAPPENLYLLDMTQQKHLRDYLFPRKRPPHLPTQLYRLALLSEAFHPNPKSQGVFYTPPELVNWLVQQSFLYIDPLHHFRFCAYDPACGAGLFLWSTYLHLCELHPEATEAQCRYWQEHLLGTDIDPLAIEVARFGLSQLWWAAFPNTPLPHYKIQAGDTLRVSTGETAGFRLAIEDELTALEQVDLIIGNPPYVGEKGNREAFQVLKDPVWKKYYRPRGDLYYYFFYVTLHLLKDRKSVV